MAHFKRLIKRFSFIQVLSLSVMVSISLLLFICVNPSLFYIAALRLGDPCSNDSDCSILTHSQCDFNKGVSLSLFQHILVNSSYIILYINRVDASESNRFRRKAEIHFVITLGVCLHEGVSS